MLARLDRPFLLDFARNQIFIMDFPGGAAYLRGCQRYSGGQALRSACLDHSVRCVAYSYATQGGFSQQSMERRARPENDPWIRREALLALGFAAELLELGQSSRRIFDDGEIFVLDLLETVSQAYVYTRERRTRAGFGWTNQRSGARSAYPASA